MKHFKPIPVHDHLKFLAKIRVDEKGCWIVGKPKAESLECAENAID